MYIYSISFSLSLSPFPLKCGHGDMGAGKCNN